MELAKAVLDFIAYLTQMVKRIFEAIENFGKTHDARSLEAFVEQQVKAFGAVIMETGWRLRMSALERPRSLPCPCGRRQHYVGPRPRALTAAPDPKLSDTARAVDPRWIAYRTIGYFEENRSRMKYPEYREKGMPIGSGVVESGCKHVVADRLKRTGMRWDEPGAENILALRCHDLNGRWDTAWSKSA